MRRAISLRIHASFEKVFSTSSMNFASINVFVCQKIDPCYLSSWHQERLSKLTAHLDNKPGGRLLEIHATCNIL